MRIHKLRKLYQSGWLSRAFGRTVRKFTWKEEKRRPEILILLAVGLALLLLGAAGGVGWIPVPVRPAVGTAALLLFSAFAVGFAEAAAEEAGRWLEPRVPGHREQTAHLLVSLEELDHVQEVDAFDLRTGDLVLVLAGELVPADGQVVKGAALVDESAVTGESAPVFREAHGGRELVTGGTAVLSDWLVVRVIQDESMGFLEQLTQEEEHTVKPPEWKTNPLLSLCLVLYLFILIAAAVQMQGKKGIVPLTFFVLLAAGLAPLSLFALFTAAEAAARKYLNVDNIWLKDPKLLRSAEQADILLLDKAGAVSLVGRHATDFLPAEGITPRELADVAQLASLANETPEGRSIVVLAKKKFGLRGREVGNVRLVPWDSDTCLAGADLPDGQVRLGPERAVSPYLREEEETSRCRRLTAAVMQQGGEPYLVEKNGRLLGAVCLKAMAKEGIQDKFRWLHRRQIRTVLMTGDGAVGAAAVAAEVGVDDFLAGVTARTRLEWVRKAQEDGAVVAMAGTIAEEAPALAQADLALALNNGCPEARQAGNMIDLDSNAAKLVDVVALGKKLELVKASIASYSAFRIIGSAVLFFLALAGALGGVLKPEDLPSAAAAAVTVEILSIFAGTILIIRSIFRGSLPERGQKKKCCLGFGLIGLAAGVLGGALLGRLFILTGIF
ncbi:HAD-IC family P-type ATPase [Cuneatibacter sp. NSJ-177]|uniref:HAD-IC family P-type ATPase n=1 Tax=Cuneatibacter sp. NSJ-177 TaxID=2931401 RepID=UPI001FD422F3|nr:HAD-IC family P-type ATPase [Cuneatibacter sp. NSJ-177]MCJ7836608.1 HAD-IC family P-type ATPase [Cuneatibacter sp. NSJ-177]